MVRRVEGDLTLRGVTRTVSFDATLYRQRGTEANDLSQLSFRLAATINRSDFGASGYSDLVADPIRLDITARVSRR